MPHVGPFWQNDWAPATAKCNYTYNLVQYFLEKNQFQGFLRIYYSHFFLSLCHLNSLSWYSAWHPAQWALISLAPVKGITAPSFPLFTKNACFGINLLSIRGFNTQSLHYLHSLMTVKTQEEGYSARRTGRTGYLTPLLIFACLKYQVEVGEQRYRQRGIVEMMMNNGSEVVSV